MRRRYHHTGSTATTWSKGIRSWRGVVRNDQVAAGVTDALQARAEPNQIGRGQKSENYEGSEGEEDVPEY